MLLRILKRATWALDNMFISPALGRPSVSQFWYLPEPARVRDSDSLQAYLAGAGPSWFYPIDLRAKLRYPFQNAEGIVYLDYKGDTGPQTNPEAAFLYALGAHDSWLAGDQPEARETFLHYAEHFLAAQNAEGDWPYGFDWGRMRAGWTSALTQGHGASVMLRAWKLTGEQRFLEAARLAVSRFDVPMAEGGYRAVFQPAGVPYYEEHPQHPRTAFYGYMYTLIGLFELAHFAGDSRARALWDTGIASLEAMIPYFTLDDWTLYDRHPDDRMFNYHSPRYHRVATDCLCVLALLSGSSTLADYEARWRAMDRPLPRAKAFVRKAAFKVLYR